MNQPLSLAHLVRDRADTDPDLDVLTFGHEGRTQVRTYGDLWAHALRLADVFSALGVSRSEGFGLLLHNEPEFVESMIAANVLGAVFVPLDPRLRGDRLAFMVGDAGCRGVVCGADAVEAVLSIAPKAPNLESIMVVGGTEDDEVRSDLKDRSFHSLPVREQMIPKPGTARRHRLGIGTRHTARHQPARLPSLAAGREPAPMRQRPSLLPG